MLTAPKEFFEQRSEYAAYYAEVNDRFNGGE